jgi:phospholipid/cholesterol/gamma-HCH transport system permease protein
VAPRLEPIDWRVERSDTGVRLSGHLRTADAADILQAVREGTWGAVAPHVELTGVEDIDGGVVALLRSDFTDRGVHALFHGGDRFRAMLDLYGFCDEIPPSRPPRRRRDGVLAQVGRVTVEDGLDVEEILGFVGEMTVSAGRLAARPRNAHWKAIPLLVQYAGADAVPIVLIINFLVGFVMAYMSARALAMFGANVFVADLVGIAMTRQLAPIMTSIVVCGRSGAAFATELGSMKVAEELDALRTLGLQPFAWLVFPRVLALALVVPVLTILADVVGILGGLLVAITSLGLTARGFFNETRGSLSAWDVESGLIMSVAFAITIGLIACQQGFAASGGPQGVGRRTTATVVSSLFAIVFLDAAFTVFFRVVGLS